MKKFLGILVLGLLWCNVGFAAELIKIPVNDHIFKIDTKIEFNNREYNYKTIATPKMVKKDF